MANFTDAFKPKPLSSLSAKEKKARMAKEKKARIDREKEKMKSKAEAEMQAYRNEMAGGESAASNKRNRVMMSEEEKKRLRYHPEKVAAKKKAAAAKLAAEKKEAEEMGVSVESLRAMKAEAANESSAADFSRSYNKGGAVTKANCGASMKPTQKSTAAVKMACGGMAYKKGKK